MNICRILLDILNYCLSLSVDLVHCQPYALWTLCYNPVITVAIFPVPLIRSMQLEYQVIHQKLILFLRTHT